MKTLRFAIFGTGFWSRYQLAGWRELGGVECISVYNRTRAKAERFAREFGIQSIYDDAEKLLSREKIDFLDIITDAGAHPRFVELAAHYQIPVICQKPMALDLASARQMVQSCRAANVWMAIHENWRWQAPIRAVKAAVESGVVGPIHRARIDYANSFPVFDNQPFLKELKQFILTDIGSHILDVARFLFGEASSLYCQTARVHRDIQGEDVATVMMQMSAAQTVTCNLSYASPVEHDRFPETFIFIEGERGSIELSADYWLRITANRETCARRFSPPHYQWADSRYALVHSSIVACNADLLRALQSGRAPETSGADNLKTVELVFGAYDSAERGQKVTF